MAAAYQTGAASSPTNLLQALVTWLTAQGWTVDQSSSDGAGWRAHLFKGSLNVNFRSAINERIFSGIDDDVGYGIGMNVGTGYNGALAWNLQPGAPLRISDSAGIGAGMTLFSGSIAAYHFFDNGADHITIVVERSPGVFVHMGWGPTLDKVDSLEAFPYFFGSSSAFKVTANVSEPADLPGVMITAAAPMSHSCYHTTSGQGTHVGSTAFVRVDATTYSARWISNGSDAATSFMYTGRYLRCSLNVTAVSANEIHAGQYPSLRFTKDRLFQSAFVGSLINPLHCFVLTVPGNRFAHIGWPPSVFFSTANVNGFAVGSVYSIGPDDFMVFSGFVVLKAA